MDVILIVLQIIVLQTLDGREVHVNPRYIVSLSETRDEADPHGKLMIGKVHCVVNLANGKFISVAEDCVSVRRRLEEIKR